MNLSGQERAEYVNNMFAQIARRYDLMNRLMTGGQDKIWRREVIRLASLTPQSHLLDLGTGTGDLALEALRRYPGCKVTAVDFTAEMMLVGQDRTRGFILEGGVPAWCRADVLSLPFDTDMFEAVVSAFLMRNVIDVRQALSEQRRVLKDGGRMVILDTTRPLPNIFTPLVQFHLRVTIPFLGRVITRQPEAYAYLPNSTNQFMTAENLADQLKQVGFKEIHFKRLMFGTIAIHWAKKQD
jgi:demethylmenaquinone methyltransferase/2-methoxy-6-polyprenyl-1,4-benzoquinol methylase